MPQELGQKDVIKWMLRHIKYVYALHKSFKKLFKTQKDMISMYVIWKSIQTLTNYNSYICFFSDKGQFEFTRTWRIRCGYLRKPAEEEAFFLSRMSVSRAISRGWREVTVRKRDYKRSGIRWYGWRRFWTRRKRGNFLLSWHLRYISITKKSFKYVIKDFILRQMVSK